MPSSHFSAFVHATRGLSRRVRVLGDESLVAPPNPDFGYDSTPLNAVTFAQMGVDGVHYALLSEDGDLCNEAPVVQISPMDFEQPVVVLANSFVEYLALGCSLPESEVEALLSGDLDDGRKLVALLAQRFEQARLYEDEQRLRTLTSAHLSKLVPRSGASDA
jgi:hypothetical protein